MRTLFVINHNPAVNPAGRTVTREAVRSGIQANATLVLDEHNPPARWTRRDLAVLEQVKLELDQG